MTRCEALTGGRAPSRVPTYAAAAAGLLLASLAGGCGGTADEPSGWIVTDSAGVAIVENDPARPVWTEERRWRLSSEPFLEIGAVEGAEELLFDRIRHARRLDDGRLAVIDGATAQVRLFDESGRHLGSVGRQGQGPGEFWGAPDGAWSLADDSLMVFHGAAVSIFAPDGSFARQFMFESVEGRAPRPSDRLEDGSILGMVNLPDVRVSEGQRRHPMRLLRHGLEGEALGSFGDFDWSLAREPEGLYVLSYRGLVAAADSTVWYAWSERYELREVGLDGVTRRIVRLDLDPEPLTDAHVAQYKAGRRENRGDMDPEILEMILDDHVYPPTLPVISNVMVDQGGNLWVRGYQMPFSEAVRTWTIFDAEGRHLGELELPDGFSPQQIGEDFILGAATDELGVEYMRAFRIEKPGT